jgi:tRNA dimethylallyltransferase
MDKKVIIVVGPTSSGKSALAVELAKKVGGEILSADSRQVYRGLDIGSGKITKRETCGIRHHLLNVASPKKVFAASDFVRLGRKAIDDIATRNKVPIICGGTGFYIDALIGRIELPHVPPNPTLRARLEKKSAPELFLILKKKDPERAKTIDGHNPVRLVRALEILAQQSHSKRQGDTFRGRCHLAAVWVGIAPEMETLKKKIRVRLIARMKRGMVAEARRLHAAGLSWKRMEMLGLEYRYLSRHLQGHITKEQMLEELETRINQYAKRQITYWGRNKDINWFSDPKEALAFAST